MLGLCTSSHPGLLPSAFDFTLLLQVVRLISQFPCQLLLPPCLLSFLSCSLSFRISFSFLHCSGMFLFPLLGTFVQLLGLQYRGGRLTSLDASFMRCFGFFQTSSKTSRSMFFSKHRWNIASLSKKCDVLRDVLGARWPGPTMLKMVRIFNINAYVIWYCWPCYYFCQQIIIK